jgi:hypothetical protein
MIHHHPVNRFDLSHCPIRARLHELDRLIEDDVRAWNLRITILKRDRNHVPQKRETGCIEAAFLEQQFVRVHL